MALLLNNIDDLRVYLGRMINKSFAVDSLVPFISMATDEAIKKAIGTEYHDRLVTPGATPLSSDELVLKKLVERALAFYSYQKYLPFALGNDGDGGLHEPENINTKPLRIGVLEKRQRATADYAANAIEAVLELLFSDTTIFSEFWETDFGINLKLKWFRTAAELNELFPQLNTNYRLLLTLNPYFDTVQNGIVFDTIGADIMTQILAYHHNPNPVIPVLTELKTLYQHVRRFIAYAGYQEALLFLQVYQTDKGLRIYSEFDGINNSKAPEAQQWAEYKMKIDTLATSARKTVIGYLNTHADIFTDFKNSPLYRTDGKRLPANQNYKSIFRMR